MWYLLFRYGGILVALFGWIGYQMIIKKKTFQELKRDIFASVFLAGVYLLLFYLIFRT
jgi:hypothetical protein